MVIYKRLARSVKRSSEVITSAEEVHLSWLWRFDVEDRCGLASWFPSVRAGWEWRSRNSLSFLKSSRSGSSNAALM